MQRYVCETDGRKPANQTHQGKIAVEKQSDASEHCFDGQHTLRGVRNITHKIHPSAQRCSTRGRARLSRPRDTPRGWLSIIACCIMGSSSSGQHTPLVSIVSLPSCKRRGWANCVAMGRGCSTCVRDALAPCTLLLSTDSVMGLSQNRTIGALWFGKSHGLYVAQERNCAH